MNQTEIKNLLDSALAETKVDLQKDTTAVAAYMANSLVRLAKAANEPGFAEAVKAERDSVALFAGIQAVGTADAADARIYGLIQGVLFAGAKLAGGVA